MVIITLSMYNYYIFILLQITSVTLARAICDTKGFHKRASRLIAAFLDSNNFMIRKLEQQLPSDFDPDRGPLPPPGVGESKSDPIFELFTNDG